MLKYARNKIVNVVRKDVDILHTHGVLDDDIYSVEINALININTRTIISAEGKWHRWTTPACPMALDYINDAAGISIDDEDSSQKIFKVVGRKACRHFANILHECCMAAKEAIAIIEWEEKKKEKPELTPSEHRDESPPAAAPKSVEKAPTSKSEPEKPKTTASTAKQSIVRNVSGNGNGFVIDLHTHTFPASSCSSMSVEELITEAKNIGLDGICLTDHNYRWSPDDVDALKKKYDFLILRGNEITTDQGDMLVFGLELDIPNVIKLEDLRAEVEKAGAYLIVAHPFRGFLVFGAQQTGLSPEKAMERSLFKYVDGVEILNSKVTENENNFAAEVAARLGLCGTGGSDAHAVSEIGKCATRFFEPVRSEKDLVAALRKGNYQPVSYRKEKGLL